MEAYVTTAAPKVTEKSIFKTETTKKCLCIVEASIMILVIPWIWLAFQ